MSRAYEFDAIRTPASDPKATFKRRVLETRLAIARIAMTTLPDSFDQWQK
jgi:hypothetical protein